MILPLGICSRIEFKNENHELNYEVYTRRNGKVVPVSKGSWPSVDWYTVKKEDSPIPRRLVLTFGNDNGSVMSVLGEFVCEGMVWVEPKYETSCIGVLRN